MEAARPCGNCGVPRVSQLSCLSSATLGIHLQLGTVVSSWWENGLGLCPAHSRCSRSGTAVTVL